MRVSASGKWKENQYVNNTGKQLSFVRWALILIILLSVKGENQPLLQSNYPGLCSQRGNMCHIGNVSSIGMFDFWREELFDLPVIEYLESKSNNRSIMEANASIANMKCPLEAKESKSKHRWSCHIGLIYKLLSTFWYLSNSLPCS